MTGTTNPRVPARLGIRSPAGRPLGRYLLAVLALFLAAEAAPAAILARVEFGWSPFARDPAPAGIASMVAEARALMAEDPIRVAEVLGKQPAVTGAGRALVLGLRADALYLAGGDTLLEAQKLYRTLLALNLPPSQAAWAHFMVGNIDKGLGFRAEAEADYRIAAKGSAGPWTAALDFDLAALELEAGRYGEARDSLLRWLGAHGSEPGRPLALYLLGECEAVLGDTRQATAHFEAARALAPEAWLVRPEAGYAFADLLEKKGRAAEAVALLETLASRRPGTREGSRARLRIGRIWTDQGEVAKAARSYAALLDQGATADEGQEATLRLALLGVDNADRVDLNEPFPAYRYFYRPRPTLEKFAAGRDPLAAQRALVGLATLDRQQGDIREALTTLARTFQEFPESPESGRAYEAFMDLVESRLDTLSQQGAYSRVVALYEGFRAAMGWAPTRDVGPAAVRAAEAYEALGAPEMAGRLYQEVLDRGTRALEEKALRARLLRTWADEGDPKALRQWVEATPGDWQARLRLARQVLTGGDREAARKEYLEAVKHAPDPGTALRILSEADRAALPEVAAQDMLDNLKAHRRLEGKLPEGPAKKMWQEHDGLVEARLRFALGQYGEAAHLYRSLGDLEPADTYLWAVAESRDGLEERARKLFSGLIKGKDALFSGLAELQLDVTRLEEAGGKAP